MWRRNKGMNRIMIIIIIIISSVIIKALHLIRLQEEVK